MYVLPTVEFCTPFVELQTFIELPFPVRKEASVVYDMREVSLVYLTKPVIIVPILSYKY